MNESRNSIEEHEYQMVRVVVSVETLEGKTLKGSLRCRRNEIALRVQQKVPTWKSFEILEEEAI